MHPGMWQGCGCWKFPQVVFIPFIAHSMHSIRERGNASITWCAPAVMTMSWMWPQAVFSLQHAKITINLCLSFPWHTPGVAMMYGMWMLGCCRLIVLYFFATCKSNNQPVHIILGKVPKMWQCVCGCWGSWGSHVVCPGCECWGCSIFILLFIFPQSTQDVAKCLAMRVGCHHHRTLETEFFNLKMPTTLWVGIIIVGGGMTMSTTSQHNHHHHMHCTLEFF